MKTLKQCINEARVKSLPNKYKKDIDTFIDCYDRSHLKRVLDEWENGKLYDGFICDLHRNLFAFEGNPDWQKYQQLTDDYVYFKLKNRFY